MKELDQLVENFFQPKPKAFGLDQLVEMVEGLLNESRENLNKIQDEILKILKDETVKGEFGKYPAALDAELKGLTRGRITIDNTGDRPLRRALMKKISINSKFEVSDLAQISGGGTKATVKYRPRRKEPTIFTLVLKRGAAKALISNIGNFAEGVMAYALAAKAGKLKAQTNSKYPDKKPESIGLSEIIKYANEIQWDTDNEEGRRTLKKANTSLGDGDKLELTIGLDNVTWRDLNNTDKWALASGTVEAALSFANSHWYEDFLMHSFRDSPGDVIEINADGVSDQKGTTADLRIALRNAEGDYEANLQTGKISLKTKSTSQLAQAGKGEKSRSRLIGFFRDLYNYEFSPEEENQLASLDNEEMFGQDGFFAKLFQKVIDKVGNPDQSQEESYVKRLSKMIPAYAGGTDITLVQLKDADFDIFDLSRQIADDYGIRITQSFSKKEGATVPYLKTSVYSEETGKEYELISMRPRRDGKGFRFYIEKGKNFNEFYRKEKQEQEQKDLTNPPQ